MCVELINAVPQVSSMLVSTLCNLPKIALHIFAVHFLQLLVEADKMQENKDLMQKARNRAAVGTQRRLDSPRRIGIQLHTSLIPHQC